MDYPGFSDNAGQKAKQTKITASGQKKVASNVPTQTRQAVAGATAIKNSASRQGLNPRLGESLLPSFLTVQGRLHFVAHLVKKEMAISTGYAVDSIATLKAIGASDRIDNYTLLVPGPGTPPTFYAWYTYNSKFTATSDSPDYSFIASNDGVGGWTKAG